MRPFLVLRRFAALLAIFGLVLCWAETGVADVHDGHGADASGAVYDPGAKQAQSAPSEVPTGPAPAHSSQSPHTCHCVHGHAPGLPVSTGVQPWSSLVFDLPVLPEHALASVAPEPHFRPPVA